MAYRLNFSDYDPPAAPPAPPIAPPTGESIPGGPSFIGFPQPPDVPCDPTGDGWRGPPGPTGPQGTTALIQVQDTPPTYPQPGQLWFDSSNPQLYVWFVDPTSAQWVIATAYAGGLTTDAPSDGQTYGRQNGAWMNISGSGGYLPLTGATPMSGPLTLSGNATLPLHAVPLQQLSSTVAAAPFLPISGPVTATGSTTSRLLADRFADVVNVKDFGAVFDGNSHPLSAYYGTLAAAQAVYPHAVALTDEIDGVAIQAAINLCQSRVTLYSYGGTVQLPCGNGLVNRPLTISKQNVSLVSQGAEFMLNSNVNRATPSAPTRLTWTGAAVTAGSPQNRMLTVAPTDGGRLLSGTNVRGILFYCNAVAGTAGIFIASVRYATIECAAWEPAGVPYASASLTSGSQAITVASTAGLRLGESVVSASLPWGAYVASITDATHFNVSAQASATSTETITVGGEGIRFDVVDGLSDSNDTQFLHVRFYGYALAGAVNATAPLVLIGGSGVVGASGGTHFGNTSMNWFDDIQGIINNGHGLVINNSDHNFHENVSFQKIGAGVGRGLICNGSLGGNNGEARFHIFNHLADGGVHVGTNTGGFTLPANSNRILFLDRQNAAAIPTIGTGASVFISADNQNVLGFTGSAQAIVGQYPDSTIAGGNARAGNAVDLQTVRTAATQVASGTTSVIVGGASNTASGQYAIVGGGNGNIASAQYAIVVGGNANQATGLAAVVPGGSGNIASQSYAIASGNACWAELYGMTAYASGVISSGRRALYGLQILKAVSAANTTPVRLTADMAAAGAINTVNLTAASQANSLTVMLTAVDSTNAANCYSWRQPLGLLKRVVASAMTYTPIGTPVSGGVGTITGIVVTEAADLVNFGYSLTFTPPTGNAVAWRVVATVEWTRVDGA